MRILIFLVTNNFTHVDFVHADFPHTKTNVPVKDQVYINLFTSLLGASEYATVMILHSGRRLLGTAWLLPHLFFNLSH